MNLIGPFYQMQGTGEIVSKWNKSKGRHLLSLLDPTFTKYIIYNICNTFFNLYVKQLASN